MPRPGQPGNGRGSGSRGGGGRRDGGGCVVEVGDSDSGGGDGPSSSGGAGSEAGGAVVVVVRRGGAAGALALGLGAGAQSGPPEGMSSAVRAGGRSKPARSLKRSSAATRAFASASARLGRMGAASLNGRGGTSLTASAMKSFQIMAGRLPPTTWGTPWTLAIVLLAAGWPIHTAVDSRSEERRVGKECRSRWSVYL